MSYSQQFIQEREGRERTTTAQLESNRVENEEARNKRLAAEAAERQARRDANAKELAAKVAQEDAEIKTRLRAGFTGTDAEFEQAWPEMLRRFKAELALENDRQSRDRIRQNIAAHF